MTRMHSTMHLPAGPLLVNRLHRRVSSSWLKTLLFLAAAILVIALLGLINVAATADHTPSFRALTGFPNRAPSRQIGAMRKSEENVVAIVDSNNFSMAWV